MRTKYDYRIILLHKLDLLEENVTNQIPDSTLRNWKNFDLSSIFGFDIAEDRKINTELIRDFVNKKHLMKTAKVIWHINNFFSDIISQNTQVINKHFKKQFIQLIDRVKGHVKKKRLFKWTGISHQMYNYWCRSSKCVSSLNQLCFKRHPWQLSFSEVDSIKKHLTNLLPKLKIKSAVYAHMVRNDNAFCTLSTFYRYATLLGFGKIKSIKKPVKIGIKASAPKQIIHMDVTVFSPLDHTKMYIYFIQDFFIRH